MNKTRTRGGYPAYEIKIDTIFTLDDFCLALSEQSLSEPVDFKRLKRYSAKEILKRRIAWNGRRGEFQGLDGRGYDTEKFNEEYSKAKEWIIKNYPYLNSPKENP